MCFRIEQDEEDLEALANLLNAVFGEVVITETINPSSNIALTEDAFVVANRDGIKVKNMRFGLVPSWAKEATANLGNARSETAAEKPSFRSAFTKRRCLIPVTGFYEWRLDPGEKKKTPYKVMPLEDDHFFLAGLWEYWKSQDLFSFAILTTEPNELISQLHNRMPVIMEHRHFDTWLDSEIDDKDLLRSLLGPYPDEYMCYQAYDRYVSNARNKEKDKIVPIGEVVLHKQ